MTHNPNAASNPHKGVDWEGMKPHWQAGIVSISQLSRMFDVSRAAITKHWDKEGLPRSLKPKIRAVAEALVHKAVATGGQLPSEPLFHTSSVERETVGAYARLQAEAILEHRCTVRRARILCNALLAELEAQTPAHPVCPGTEVVVTAGRTDSHQRALTYMAQIALTSARLDNVRKLAEVMKMLIDLERRVLGITDDSAPEENASFQRAPAPDNSFEQLRARFKARGAQV